MIKIGIDIHGVIDKEPDIFSELTHEFKKKEYEVHILTGARIDDRVLSELSQYGIKYDKLFSILDYHSEIETKMWKDEDGCEWIPQDIWNSTKGNYCLRNEIDFHIDDTKIYGKWFKTPFGHLTSYNKYPRILELSSLKCDPEIIETIRILGREKIIVK